MSPTGTIVEVLMPQMGVSVAEGTVTKWMRDVGQEISADDTLLEISTDKVDTEVPSPGSGVLLEILVQEGQTVSVGTVLGRVGPAGAATADLEPAPTPAVSMVPPLPPIVQAVPPLTPEPENAGSSEAISVGAEPDETPRAPTVLTAVPTLSATAITGAPAGGASFVSPVVGRLAAEHGVDPSTVPGTGLEGRVTKRDILAFVEQQAANAVATGETATADSATPDVAIEAVTRDTVTPDTVTPDTAVDLPASEAASGLEQAPVADGAEPPAVETTTTDASAPVPETAAPESAPPEEARPEPAVQATIPVAPPSAPPVIPAAAVPATAPAGEHVEPMSAMRRGIAEHMRRSLDTAAHVTSAIEVDMTRVASIREKLKPELQAAYGLSPTYLAFIARASVDTLKDWPLVNGELRGDSIVTKSFVNLGFAVALEGGKGLIVPVLKHAEGLNLRGMVRGIAGLAERARTKKLLPDDVQGGSFTITNPGGAGTILGTPIINQPQSAILGTYAVVKRPWVVQDDAGQDAIAIRSIMNLTLTYDHRLIDGAYAAQFLRDLRNRLESWTESDY